MPVAIMDDKEREPVLEGFKLRLLSLEESTGVIRGIIQEYSFLIDQVFLKIKSVQGIANKTNLLAINASIETIHASDLLASFEEIVTKNLIIQAKIIAQILEYDPDFLYQDGGQFARDCGMEEFFITDGQGVIQFTNVAAWKNSTLNSSDMLRILTNPELEVALPAVGNGFDSEQYKVVGISRTDQQGIIQVGAHFVRPKGQLAINGFGVVAQEAKRLADVSKEISSRITAMTNDLGAKLRDLEQAFETVQASMAKCSGSAEQAAEETDRSDMGNAMRELKLNLTSFETSLRESRKYFRDILSPLTELINIARQTNLLGVRAAIEAAHSTNDKQDFDNLMNRHMTAEAKLVAILVERRPDMTCDDVSALADYIGLDEIWIPDGNAVVELTNVPGGKGFQYVNEGQTAPYMRLLANPELIVTAPPEPRALDGKVFKYVGVGRKGKSGFVQIGKVSKLYGESTAEGFSVVAKQIKNLAEQSREITTEIETVVEGMDFKAQKAADHMKSVQKHRLEAEAELERLNRSLIV
jgi:Methyl-accepting chemotaxis protein